jgi:hypothetical protein
LVGNGAEYIVAEMKKPFPNLTEGWKNKDSKR